MPTLHLDRLGSVIAGLIGLALFASPFVTYRANRIVSGEGRPLVDALPPAGVLITIAVVLGVALCAVLARKALVRMAAASLDLATLQGLNARVQVGGEPAKAVAMDYLKSKGFLK